MLEPLEPKYRWLIRGTVLAVVTCVIGLLFQPVHNFFFPSTPAISSSPSSTETQAPTSPEPDPTPSSPSPSPTTRTTTNTPSPENAQKTTRTPESKTKNTSWAPRLKEASATQWCEWPGNIGHPWSEIKSIDDPVTISQQPYSDGFACRMGRNLASGYIDFVVPQGAASFSVIVGQSDYSHDTNVAVTFELSNADSGEVLATATTSMGDAASLAIDVSSSIKIRLSATADAGTGAAPKKHVDVLAVWANPLFS